MVSKLIENGIEDQKNGKQRDRVGIFVESYSVKLCEEIERKIFFRRKWDSEYKRVIRVYIVIWDRDFQVCGVGDVYVLRYRYVFFFILERERKKKLV